MREKATAWVRLSRARLVPRRPVEEPAPEPGDGPTTIVGRGDFYAALALLSIDVSASDRPEMEATMDGRS